MLKTIGWALLVALNIYLIAVGLRNIGTGLHDGNVWLVLWGALEIAVGSWKFTQPFKEVHKK